MAGATLVPITLYGRRRGVILVRIATLYMIAGLVVGIAMGVSKDFTLMSLHAHVLLLGWATMAITGLVYISVPPCDTSRLATVHTSGHNIGLPVMSVGLALGEPRGEPLIIAGSLIVVAALVVFAANVFLNGGKPGEPTTSTHYDR